MEKKKEKGRKKENKREIMYFVSHKQFTQHYIFK